MRTRAIRRIAVLVAGLAALVMAAPAWAQTSTGMTICNQSPNAVTTAIGYHSPGVGDPADHSILTGMFVTRGWLRIEAGACHTFQNPFNARYMYWYGFDSHRNPSGPSTSADTAMTNPLVWCVNNYWYINAPFTYEIENSKTNDSENVVNHCNFSNSAATDFTGYWVYFNLVDTWVAPRVNLTGAEFKFQ